MERKIRPSDDRDSGELKAWEVPDTDADAPASCPLMGKVTLLPLRYGRTETPPPGSAPGLAYSLKSRPLGYRMLRDGFIYIYDEADRKLKEYQYQKNELSGGPMEYKLDRVLYVSFSDVQWTAKKQAQITESDEERQYWMQRVNLNGVSPLFGGEHLLTVAQASEWVAEFAEDFQPEPIEGAHPEETVPYIWENQPYYHKTRVGKLLKQQNVTDPDESLCLVLKDDVGVMLDLAEHQDVVVGWLEQWAGHENNERDYVLGALIESMTLLTPESLGALMEANRNPAIRAVREDLEAMEPEARAKAEAALTEILNDLDGKGLPSPNDPSLPQEVRREIDDIRSEANRSNYYDISNRMKEVVERWYWKESLEGVDPNFVERNYSGLQRLEKEQRAALKAALHGQGFGDRGINDLIDREAMDSFMEQQRAKLARWQPQLDMITDDRLDMVYSGRLHRATWYFDPNDMGQVEAALDIQYACLKDTCRSDKAAEIMLAWMEENPQYHHPLFQTLPLDAQSAEAELSKTYADVTSAGYSVVTKATDWIKRIRQAESSKLPQLEQLSGLIQQKADAIGDVLSPAVSMGMARSLQKLYESVGGNTIPDLDELFRELPFFFKHRMLRAIEAGEAEFRFASQSDLAAFRQDVQKMIALRERMSELRSARNRVKAESGHRAVEAERLLNEFREAREEHRAIGKRVANALSPVDTTDTGIRVSDGAPYKAALTIVAPAAAQAQVGQLVAHFRQGLSSAPKINLVGDGLGWVVFAAQFASLWKIIQDSNLSDSGAQPQWTKVAIGLTATSGAGFLAAQGLLDTVYNARAKDLAQAWSSRAVGAVKVRMGVMHAGLGSFAYVLGGVSSAVAFSEHRSRWQTAVQSGNSKAQAGAIVGMIGSGGLGITQSYGFYRSVRSAVQVLRIEEQAARRTAWAAAGTRLSSLFFRLNLAGLVFTVFELSGTWLYNRYNLNRQDRWLQTVPWSKEPNYIHNGTLAEYESALVKIADSVSLAHERGEDRRRRLVLSCQSLPRNALAEQLGVESPFRLSVAAWQIQPDRQTTILGGRETWVSCTDELVETVELVDGGDHLQLAFIEPTHKRTMNLVKTRDFALQVRVESRNSVADLSDEVYLLKIVPGRGSPITPTDEKPKGDAHWREIIDPQMSLDNS